MKLSSIKGILHFGKKGKLRPRYVGPFKILERVVDVAYRLALTSDLSIIHNIFHVSILRRYIPDPSHCTELKNLEANMDPTYEEQPTRILGKKVKTLRNREISLVLVQWNQYREREATWERE